MQPKRKQKGLLLILLLTFLHVFLFAQSVQIKGKVSDAVNKTPIEGATVSFKGKATITNAQGEFTISAEKGGKLSISYVGFEEQHPIVGNQLIAIMLLPNDKVMTEVVVTALGIKKDLKRLGYATQEVKGADLTKARDVNPIQSLTGKVAGLTVGASAEMLARPQIVMRGSTDLLFVVDGVPINSDTWNVSADDIESYNVLKGANAAALYGFRGINGAIIITTKRGSKDKKGWQVDFNSSTMFEHGFLTVPQAQTEYGRGTKFVYSYGDVLYDNKQRLQEYGPRFEGQLVKQYDSPFDPVTGIRTATPWTARGAKNFENFMQTGVLSTNNLSLSASGTNYDVRMSYSHTYQKGTAPNTGVNFDNFNLNTGYNFTDRLRLEGNLNFNIQYSPNIPDASYGPNSYTYMFKVYGSSDYDINDLKNIYKGPQGVNNLTQYAPEYGRENSAWFIADKWLRTHNKTDVYGYLKLNYKVAEGLNASIRSQITTWNQNREEIVPASTNLNTYLPWYYFGWYGDYRLDQRQLIENNTDFLLTYTKKFSNWNLDANAGVSERSLRYNSFWGTSKDLAIPNVYALSNSINPALSYSYLGKMQVYSGYYSFDLGYKNYFTITNTGRVDQLSTLPSGNNTFFYPSVAISSVLSDYLHLPKSVSFLKLRASYADVKGGLTQSAISSAYSAVTGNSTNGLLGYGTDLKTSYDGPSYTNQNQYLGSTYYNGQTSINYSNTVANPNLKPYSVKSFEAGTDIRFLKNRIGLDITYFNTVNGPLIYQLPVASSTGFYAQNVNGITSLKQGIEIALNASPFKNPKGFSWDISANWSTFKETLKAIYGNQATLTLNGHNFTVGERMDNYYSTKFVRDPSGNVVYGTNTGLPLQGPTDINNNGLIGHLNPDFSFGVNNRFAYKGFYMSFQVDGRIGGKIYDRVLYQGNNAGTSLTSASGDFGVARLKEWQSTANGTKSPTPAYVGQGVQITSGTPIYVGGQITNAKDITFAPNTTAVTVQSYLSSGIGGNFDEYYSISRSFAKLREVQIGYTFANLKNSFFKTASVTLIGRNLLYFAARKDFDIEQYASGFNLSDRSVGGNSNTDLQSATSRRFGANLNLSF